MESARNVRDSIEGLNLNSAYQEMESARNVIRQWGPADYNSAYQEMESARNQDDALHLDN